jgi:hypothetical protein
MRRFHEELQWLTKRCSQRPSDVAELERSRRRQGRGALSQAAVRAFEVVFVGVIAGGGIDFAHIEEEFAIQQFQPYLGMEAFHMAVFLGRARLDVTRPNLGLLQPAPQ